MCGIGGYFRVKPPCSAAALTEALRHRGPDGDGRYVDEVVALYHTRLSIIDLSEAASQPMADESGQVVIVFNGEIYNYPEQRDHLLALGRRFRSHSDTEVILRLYIEYGEDFVKYLRGIFALAIYDKREGCGKEKLILARDPFGVKPLLFASLRGGALVFGSELKALLASGKVSKTIDHIALRDLLTVGSIYQPRTILRDVRALLPGHIMVCRGDRVRERTFWEFGAGRVSGLATAGYEDTVSIVHDVIRNSVQRQLVSDVPVCCFLSGGIDSALTTAMMVQMHNSRVCTYSVGFENRTSQIDETADAGVVARHLGTDHHEVVIRDREVIDLMSYMGKALDQPSVNGINSYFISKAVASEYKVALSGTGGDELFAGYPWFQAALGFKPPKLSCLAGIARRMLSLWTDPSSLFFKWAFSDTAGYFSLQYQILGLRGALRAMAPHLREQAGGYRDSFLAIGERDQLRKAGILNQTSVLCLTGYTRNQLLRDIDAMSMACGIEVRVPFLDPDVADVAMSLPDQYKIGQRDLYAPAGSYSAEGVKKVLLEIGKRYLPSDFGKRPKRGFNMPVADWLRGPLRGLVSETLEEVRLKRGGLFDPQYVREVQERVDAGMAPASDLWLLFITSLWNEQVLEN
jgi:asparagine synthase (glutamine-hydrolysing)